MVGIKDSNKMPSRCKICGHWHFDLNNKPVCDLTYKYIGNIYKRQDDCPLVEAIPKDQYESSLSTDMATIKQLSSSVKILQKANSEIAGAYDKLKADYENRLKTDMVAMLTELKEDIESKINHYSYEATMYERMFGCDECEELVQ